MTVSPGLGLVRAREVTVAALRFELPIRPGDRVRVAVGQAVERGTPVADLGRDLRTEVVPALSAAAGARPGDDAGAALGPRLRGHSAAEILFESGGRHRLAVADHVELLESPVAGVVDAVRPGTAIAIRATGPGVLGREVVAGPASGRLEIISARDGEVRAADIDVSSAGAIVVAGGTIDAEAITRARAVGLRGIIVAALGTKERREVLASERRGRAAAHGLPPFAILVLDGAQRRPIAAAFMAAFEALVGRGVAIVGSPPALVVDGPVTDLPPVPTDVVRIVAGPLAGAEGRWVGPAGPRRYSGGVLLESGLVRFGSRPPLAVPLGDLERFA